MNDHLVRCSDGRLKRTEYVAACKASRIKRGVVVWNERHDLAVMTAEFDYYHDMPYLVRKAMLETMVDVDFDEVVYFVGLDETEQRMLAWDMGNWKIEVECA